MEGRTNHKTFLIALVVLLFPALLLAAPSDITTSGTVESEEYQSGASNTLPINVTGSASTTSLAAIANQLTCSDCVGGTEIDESSLSGTASNLIAGDISCTNCLTATDIEDIYLFNTGDTATGDYDFQDGSSNTIFYIDSTNNRVGINTSSPLYDLHVVGKALVQDTGTHLYLNETGQSGSTGVWKFDIEGGAFRLIMNNASGRDFSTFSRVLSVTTDSNLRLGGAGTGVVAETMRILPNASSVGIGVGAPDEFLHLRNDDDDTAIQFQIQNASDGPRSGTVFKNDDSAGNNAWENVSYARASDDTYANTTLAWDWSYYLNATGFNFNIPEDATILGIKVEIEMRRIGTGIRDENVYIVKGGSYGATDKSQDAILDATDTYRTYGGATDLWSETWTPSDINDEDFGVAIRLFDSTA